MRSGKNHWNLVGGKNRKEEMLDRPARVVSIDSWTL